MWVLVLGYSMLGLGVVLLLPLTLSGLCCLCNLGVYALLWCASWRCTRCLQRNHCRQDFTVSIPYEQAVLWNMTTDYCPCTTERHEAHCQGPCMALWRVRFSTYQQIKIPSIDTDKDDDSKQEDLYYVCPCARCHCAKCNGVRFDCSCLCYYCRHEYYDLIPCKGWMVLLGIWGLLIMAAGISSLWYGVEITQFIEENIHDGVVMGMLASFGVFLCVIFSLSILGYRHCNDAL